MSKIESRKTKKRVQFLSADEKPLANAKVNANLVNHEFLFGCGAFEALHYTNTSGNHAGNLTGASEKIVDQSVLDDRMNKWLELFNYGTLPFYWGGFEPEEGSPHTEQLMKAAKFLKEKGVIVKGHPLCWHTSCAQWLLKYDNETIMNKQLERIYREVGGFKGIIDMWDVINEVVIMPIYDKYDNPVTRICKEHGRVGLVKKVFDAAYKMNPDGTFLINDFNLSTNYEILIDGCLNAGVPINTIGLQSHQHHGVWGVEKQDEILSRFEHFGLPIHFTENTIVAGPKVPEEIVDLQDAHFDDDAATPELEQMQADKLEEMYRNLYENHPLVTAITNWDYGDGAWLNAPSGVIRKDGTLKPSYERLHKLIKEEWHTNTTFTTDANGYAEVEGYKGDYEITAEIGGKPVKAKLPLRSAKPGANDIEIKLTLC